ncbi:2-phospho-L-lactate guanylyltransferase [Cellulomonas sp. PhB143]|uniref:2-phospho-L-lactate guanylyltransferase n=1 Tax=Cellulomonas sp. PhB143 TaxID=2485186 RepID=UPI000F489C33|nr:2-phospho-L-lactate guanylyltransferase [Cellulomonas sp. PhB143]ROS77086.1 2-phospho-L-lactate guanylyltransferase [Cellulomonas sp. PhB143]
MVPVKRLTGAKSRLEVAHPPATSGFADASAVRRDLARAFALDTLAAVRATPGVARVVLVSSEPSVVGAPGLETPGASGVAAVEVVPDPGDGLGAAVAAGVAHAGSGARAVLLGDLPSLRAADLEAALRACGGRPRAVVPDAAGTGTTLLTARAGQRLEPRFGSGSAAAHARAGHAVVTDVGERVRRDVDTAADLEAAVRLGVGPRTAHVLAGLTG